MNRIFIVDEIDERSEMLMKLLKLKQEVVIRYSDSIEKNLDCFDKCYYIFFPKSDIKSEFIKVGSVVFFYLMQEETKAILIKNNIRLINVQSDTNFVTKNSQLTAERSLAYIIENTPIELGVLEVLILGCGNLAKSFIKLLKKFNVKTYIYTKVRHELKDVDFNVLSLRKLKDLSKYDVIINTIPQKIVPDNIKLKEGVFVLELASNNYQFNYDELDKRNIKYVIAKSVPAKLCKESSAKLLLDTILNYL